MLANCVEGYIKDALQGRGKPMLACKQSLSKYEWNTQDAIQNVSSNSSPEKTKEKFLDENIYAEVLKQEYK